MKALILMLILLMTQACDYHPESLILSGTLEVTEYSVGAPVPGRLATITIEESDTVDKGEIIATLDRYDKAKRDYERIYKLEQQGGATKQDVEAAELMMKDQSVISPVAGVVLVKVHEVGEVAAAGSPVAVIGDQFHPWICVYVPEGMISRVGMNQQAIVRFDGLEQDFHGRVIFVAPQAEFTPRNVQTAEERVTQTFKVKIGLDPEEIGPNIRPGVKADVIIPLAERGA